MHKEQLEALTEQYGYPLYIYDENVLAAQRDTLLAALPGFDILYSFKTNPHPAVCAFMQRSGLGADVASSVEVTKAEQAGFAPHMIMYSAPGKRDSDIERALGRAVLVADSYTELALIERICEAKNTTASVGLRINPDLSFGPGASPELLRGAPAKFGVDAESLPAHAGFLASLRRVRVAGIHVYLRSQVRNHLVIHAYLKHILDLARFCVRDMGWNMEFINFGGGFGVPYAATDTPIDWAAFTPMLEKLMAEQDTVTPRKMRFIAESGRYLTSAAGTFVTRITDVKESRGRCFVLAPGALNNFLRPALTSLLASLSQPVPGPMEPLYSGPGSFALFIPGREGEETVPVTVSGTLCTALDCMAADTMLPRPRIGDLLCVRNAGAYACTLSPHEFAGMGRPKELYLDTQGAVTVYPE